MTSLSASRSVMDRSGIIDGARGVFPLVVPAIPFGLVLGVAINEATINRWIGWSSSWIVFGGSSQIVAVQMLDEAAGIFFIALTMWVINARHIMYSAALASRFRDAPRWWKLLVSYVLIDQAFALVDALDDKRPLRYQMGYLFGAGLMAWGLWNIWVLLGVILGDVIPTSWSLAYAIPILFLVLMILAIKNLPAVVAAVVGGLTAVVGSDLPNGTGLLVGAVIGIIAGTLCETILERQSR